MNKELLDFAEYIVNHPNWWGMNVLANQIISNCRYSNYLRNHEKYDLDPDYKVIDGFLAKFDHLFEELQKKNCSFEWNDKDLFDLTNKHLHTREMPIILSLLIRLSKQDKFYFSHNFEKLLNKGGGNFFLIRNNKDVVLRGWKRLPKFFALGADNGTIVINNCEFVDDYFAVKIKDNAKIHLTITFFKKFRMTFWISHYWFTRNTEGESIIRYPRTFNQYKKEINDSKRDYYLLIKRFHNFFKKFHPQLETNKIPGFFMKPLSDSTLGDYNPGSLDAKITIDLSRDSSTWFGTIVHEYIHHLLHEVFAGVKLIWGFEENELNTSEKEVFNLVKNIKDSSNEVNNLGEGITDFMTVCYLDEYDIAKDNSGYPQLREKIAEQFTDFIIKKGGWFKISEKGVSLFWEDLFKKLLVIEELTPLSKLLSKSLGKYEPYVCNYLEKELTKILNGMTPDEEMAIYKKLLEMIKRRFAYEYCKSAEKSGLILSAFINASTIKEFLLTDDLLIDDIKYFCSYLKKGKKVVIDTSKSLGLFFSMGLQGGIIEIKRANNFNDIGRLMINGEIIVHSCNHIGEVGNCMQEGKITVQSCNKINSIGNDMVDGLIKINNADEINRINGVKGGKIIIESCKKMPQKVLEESDSKATLVFKGVEYKGSNEGIFI